MAVATSAMNAGPVITGLALLVLFSGLLNLPYFHVREFQGEEGRRVVVAEGMLRTGEWAVPRFEGEVYLNKPPLYNWVLAGAFRTAGTVSEASARLPSIVMAFLCAAVLSILWREISGVRTPWYILPGVIFLTFPDVMDKAVKAEIDMAFTLFITLSLCAWFYFHELRGNGGTAWLLSLGFVGLGALTKGIQAPAFFYCAVVPYLIYRRHARELFSLAHLAGVVFTVAMFSVWLGAVSRETDLPRLIGVWIHEIAVRQEPLRSGGFVRHLAEFPLEYLLAYAPWLAFLGLWSRGAADAQDEGMRRFAVFCSLCLVISVPVYWVIPGARLRYLLPLSGLLAVLVAIPVQRLLAHEHEEPGWCRWYMRVLGGAVAVAGATVPLWGGKAGVFDRPLALLPLAGMALAGLMLWRGGDFRRRLVTLVILLLLVKISWAAVYFPYHARNLSHYRTAATEINGLAPGGAEILDYGVLNPHLTFYLGRTLTAVRSLDDERVREGALVLMKKETAEKSDLGNFIFLGEIRARRTTLVLLQSASEPPRPGRDAPGRADGEGGRSE